MKINTKVVMREMSRAGSYRTELLTLTSFQKAYYLEPKKKGRRFHFLNIQHFESI